MARTDLTLSLLQLVALALPAVVIYLSVLVEVYRDVEELKKDTRQNPSSIETLHTSFAHTEPAFTFAKISLFLFLLGGIVLLAYLPFSRLWVLWFGEFLLGLALLSFAFSILLIEGIGIKGAIQKLQGTYEYFRSF